MLHVARRLAVDRGLVSLGLLAADAEAIPLTDRSVSLVTCRIAPHHFADVGSFVREVARVLTPEGRFLLIDSLAPADSELDEQLNELERYRDPSHVRSLGLAAWCRLLMDAGLQIRRVEVISRWHEWEDWTARSGLIVAEREELARWLLSRERLCRFLDVQLQDGGIFRFRDDKVLILAHRPRVSSWMKGQAASDAASRGIGTRSLARR